MSPRYGDAFLDQRRRLVRASRGLWGLEWVETEALDEPDWRLTVHFLPDDSDEPAERPPVDELRPRQVRILLGEREQPGLDVRSVDLERHPETGEWVLRVLVRWPLPERDRPAHRTLRVVDAPWLDRFLQDVKVIFADGQEAGRTAPGPAPPPLAAPSGTTDYRVKDYAGFRRLLLDRMAVQVPEWGERNPADLGVTIVELLAWAADRLSYFQDAAAGEAYLETSRRRVSKKRHARLLDFRLHEGLEARVWLAFHPGRSALAYDASRPWIAPAGLQVANLGSPEEASRRIVRSADLEKSQMARQQPLIFHTLEPVEIRPDLADLRFYGWGSDDFVLEAGALSAHLEGRPQGLHRGDVLLLLAFDEEGRLDNERSQPVRLDREPARRVDPSRGEPLTEIHWYPDDALRHSLRVGDRETPGVRVVGNVVPADQGPITLERLPDVPTVAEYRPSLEHRRVAHCQPFDAYRARRSAAADVRQMDPTRAVPRLDVFCFEAGDRRVADRLGRWLDGLVERGHMGDAEGAARELAELDAHVPVGSGELERRVSAADLETWRRMLRHAALATVQVTQWTCQADLLNSGPTSHDFVLESEEGDLPVLRFGDGFFGRRPPPGARVVAIYRQGRGTAGNVGSNALDHLVLDDLELAALGDRDLQVYNPLPSFGGTSAQRAEEARLFAPEIFREQRRAVVLEDYAATARRHREVADAAARWSWAGAGRVAVIHVSRRDDLAVDAAFRGRLEEWFEPFLLAGRRVEIRAPILVPVEIALRVDLEPGQDPDLFRYLLEHPERDAGGSLAELFTPGRFGFGEDVYLSEVVAAVAAMPDVAQVRVDRFRRAGDPTSRDRVAAGRLEIGPCEIARLGHSYGHADGFFSIEIEEAA